jgi:hypothetical protein
MLHPPRADRQETLTDDTRNVNHMNVFLDKRLLSTVFPFYDKEINV